MAGEQASQPPELWVAATTRGESVDQQDRRTDCRRTVEVSHKAAPRARHLDLFPDRLPPPLPKPGIRRWRDQRQHEGQARLEVEAEAGNQEAHREDRPAPYQSRRTAPRPQRAPTRGLYGPGDGSR